jgi:HEAT repeat protein
MGLVRVEGKRQFGLFVIALVLISIPGVLGLWTSEAARVPAPALWEPEYEGLQSPDPEVRAQTVQKLAATQNPDVASALLQYLGDPDQKVGLYLAQTLGGLAEEDVLVALRLALSDPDPNIRWRAALALGEQRDVQAVPDLTRLLQDPEKLVQNAAASALAQMGTRQAVYALAAGLGSAQPSTVNNTMNGLQRVGPAAVPTLTSILDSSNSQARRNAVILLGYIADPEAVPALQRKAALDPDAEVRTEAGWALGEIKKAQTK